jgi:hypothetical protein
MSEQVATAWPAEKDIPPILTGQLNCPKPEPLVVPLLQLARASSDDASTLLGNRFLCRAGGLLWVGSCGIGKSTSVVQAGICWSGGRPCFGIAPRQALKILYVQAENDAGDLCEMRDGVLQHLNLEPEELDRLEANFICVFESSRTGAEFITETLQPLLEEHSPDLIILDPVLSYLGGNANDQEVVGRFLRNLLNPMLQKYNCGAILVHHTAKPLTRDGVNRMATDFAYLGAGSAEWANWARAVLILSAKDDGDLRELRIGKRFRLGWKDAVGAPSVTRLIRQNAAATGFYYTELSAEEAIMNDGKMSPLQKVLCSGVLPESGEDVSKKTLIARITSAKLCGRDKARDEVLPSLVDEGYLEEEEVARHGKRPEIRFVRTSKLPGSVSFAAKTKKD